MIEYTNCQFIFSYIRTMNKKIWSVIILSVIIIYTNSSCNPREPKPNRYSTLDDTYGFGVLSKLNGIWKGPVNSSTHLGNFPTWIVDFRPIAENQISSKNELDSLNDIQMSFFIAKYDNEYRVCFRNGGHFAGMTRITYQLCDSVYEQGSYAYYRFSEIIKGKDRVYTDVICQTDSLRIVSYTNKSNSMAMPVMHMDWRASIQDRTSSNNATSHFAFPKKSLTRDLSGGFDGLNESVIYNNAHPDPYPDNAQPYTGTAQISYTYGSGYTPTAGKNVLLLITTQPLFTGLSYDPGRLRYISRYVLVSSSDTNFDFIAMHPGTYYVYPFYDNDGNTIINSGDWMSISNTSFTLNPQGISSATSQINFTIP